MRPVAIIAIFSFLMVGCATATPTQKGAVAGSAIGAGIGAIIGHQSGNTAEGALIGAAAGGLGGALLGDAMATKFCPACGRQYLSTDPDRCAIDGAVLQAKGVPAQSTQQQQTQVALPKFCPKCGESYPESATYCGKDGTALKAKKQ